MVRHERGKRNSVNKKPTTSSITISEGSLSQSNSSLRAEAQMAAALPKTMIKTPEAVPKYVRPNTRGKAAIVPKVPGATGRRPMPNQVDNIKEIFPEKLDSLKVLHTVNLSDRDFDIKQVLVVYFCLWVLRFVIHQGWHIVILISVFRFPVSFSFFFI